MQNTGGDFNPGNFITIVSGLPRSGTSLMMRMLDVGGIPALTDNIRGADKDNPNGYYEFEPVKQLARDHSWLPHAEGKAVKIIYRLLYELPSDRSYKVLFMRRSIDEIVRSQRVMLTRNSVQGSSLDDARLSALFQSELDTFNNWVRTQAHIGLYAVEYSEVVQNTRSMVEKIQGFLERPLDGAAMVRCVDGSLHRQRRADSGAVVS